jgi:hypothetical protein
MIFKTVKKISFAHFEKQPWTWWELWLIVAPISSLALLQMTNPSIIMRTKKSAFLHSCLSDGSDALSPIGVKEHP